MASKLHPCPACTRHIRSSESVCPFCNATMAEGFGVVAQAQPLQGPITRAALLFAGATALAACSSDPATPGGADASIDAAKKDGSIAQEAGEPVALYGPAPVQDAAPMDASPMDASPTDAKSNDANDAAQDSGGPVALYGPAPVDSGAG